MISFTLPRLYTAPCCKHRLGVASEAPPLNRLLAAESSLSARVFTQRLFSEAILEKEIEFSMRGVYNGLRSAANIVIDTHKILLVSVFLEVFLGASRLHFLQLSFHFRDHAP